MGEEAVLLPHRSGAVDRNWTASPLFTRRLHDPQDGMAVNILQREIDEMTVRVNANSVCVRH